MDVVTLGETMVLFVPTETGPLKYIYQFNKHIGGAESNVAIGLSRLGIKVGWISKLGKDGFGDYVESFIKGEGVDVSQVKRDEEHPTGVFFKERVEVGESKIYYYRKGSAASFVAPDDLNEDYIAQAKYLHLTGITPGLSESCCKAVYKAVEIAKKYGLKIVFDPNIRLKVWNNKEQMKKTILDIVSKSDILLPGLSEAKILLEMSDEIEILNKFLLLGPKIVVLKVGKEGAYLGTRDEITHVPGYRVERIVDPIGAGDAFAAGFLASLIKGYTLKDAVTLANAAGAFALTVKGDVEGLPTWEDLHSFLGNDEEFTR
ncbi:sugar kinase [Petrotoga sp. 9PWA.NaAc.5.4]|uniref:sugar kinase n=1 Tax=Petrotoga sp. 9PWA.NaAc.5.4 TaxID=1434328 RepID=UPI0018EB9C78|nr:sugar kinase [Petrotoga sp. 9PWA.NaAc.5.4]